jgi:hypothetical protein
LTTLLNKWPRGQTNGIVLAVRPSGRSSALRQSLPHHHLKTAKSKVTTNNTKITQIWNI